MWGQVAAAVVVFFCSQILKWFFCTLHGIANLLTISACVLKYIHTDATLKYAHVCEIERPRMFLFFLHHSIPKPRKKE